AKGIDAIYCMSVNDSYVMNKWAQSQNLENVSVIPDGSGEFTRKIGMLVKKDDVGFGMRSWRYAAIINNGVVEAWFEEPGKADDRVDDPYGESSPENLLKYLDGGSAA
ncbi:MAG: redoxin family protein, partial [Proteobacteria bacterium]|nr:redoxin family protein [Pseudomonadota bacterium]